MNNLGVMGQDASLWIYRAMLLVWYYTVASDAGCCNLDWVIASMVSCVPLAGIVPKAASRVLWAAQA